MANPQRTGNNILAESSPGEDDGGRALPYGLVPLYDMLKFAAEEFWKAAQTLTEIRNNPASANSPSAAQEMRIALTALLGNLKALDLPVSVKEFEKFNIWMNRTMREIAAISPIEKQKAEFFKIEPEVKTKLLQLCSVVHSELESRQFFHISPKDAAYYDQKELFGLAVNSRFPTIQYDMVEAANCFALGRGTACVFHLMRIMEVGVQEFGTALGVAFVSDKNWQNILDEINKAIKALPSKDPKTVAMSAAAANLYAVKLAWRNEVMHPNDTYTLEEAESLIRLVKLFMEHLAGII
jgi:hypothetical protein